MADIVGEVKTFVSECWKNIFAEVRDAVVYVDHGAIECLHWHTAGKGYLTLKDAGAVAVYELGMYQFRYAEVKESRKAVVVSTSGDPAFYQRTIKMILAKNAFESCIVFCSVPCCTLDPPETCSTISQETVNYGKLKKDIKSWMSSGNLSQEPTADVFYAPIFVALLNGTLLATPPFRDLTPSLDGTVSPDTSAQLRFLAYSFYKLLDGINARLDIYSVGKLSDRLAENLQGYMSGVEQRNPLSDASEIGISLIAIDRTLDLCTPTSNATESFLTKILRTFPRLPHHDNDVAIDLSPVFGRITETLQSHQVPGCLASVEQPTMDLFISQTEKKLLAMANEFLNDIALAKDSPKLRTPTRISGHSLEKTLGKIRSTVSADTVTARKEKVQCILAIIEASTSKKAGQLELLTGLEKLALQSLSVSRESSSILAQLSNIIRTRIHRGLDMENLLALLIHVYALAGTQIRFSAQQERQLEESIADAIFQDLEILRKNPVASTKSTYHRTLLLLGGNDAAGAKETSENIAMRVMDSLRLVAEQRLPLQDYRCFISKTGSEEGTRRVGILEQITRDVFCADAGRELRDLRTKSSSLISAGFNLILRGKAKRHPRDNPYVLIYVIGGMTAEEAKIVQEIASLADQRKSPKSPRIILAASRLLNPSDVADKIFFSQ